jgi:hypothetical protein
MLQMLVTFLTLFKEASLQLEADKYATLPLVLPVRFSLLNHLNVLPHSHELFELRDHACKILNEKNTTQKLYRITSFIGQILIS